MFCENCGNEVADGNAFCAKCGTPCKDVVSAESADQSTKKLAPEDIWSMLLIILG